METESPPPENSRELERKVELFVDELLNMTPGEAVALARHRSDFEDDREGSVYKAYDELPARHPEHAARVFQAFADSPLFEDRYFLGYIIPALTIHNHDLGLELWKRLAQDEVHEVWANAMEDLHDLPEDEQERQERLRAFGLTHAEVQELRLLEEQSKLNKGQFGFDLGRYVIERVRKRLEDVEGSGS